MDRYQLLDARGLRIPIPFWPTAALTNGLRIAPPISYSFGKSQKVRPRRVKHHVSVCQKWLILGQPRNISCDCDIYRPRPGRTDNLIFRHMGVDVQGAEPGPQSLLLLDESQ